MLQDRLTRGFLAGLAGGIVMNLYSVIVYSLHWTDMPFWQWAVIIILGKENISTTATLVIGVFGHIFFTALLGVVFSFFIRYFSSRLIILKGWLYAISAWFAIYAVTLFSQV